MERFRLPLALPLITLLLVLPPAASFATTCEGATLLKPVHRIWGVVFLDAGEPLANARVSVSESYKEIAVTKTDDHGKFSFDQLKAGHYKLLIRLEDRPTGVAGTEVVLVRPSTKSQEEIAVGFNPTAPACSSFSLEDAEKFEAGLNPGDPWFQDDCTGATFEISKVQGAPDQKIVLRLQTGQMNTWHFAFGAGWVPVKGKLCSNDDKCEDAAEAELWLDKSSEEENQRRVSGKYKLDVAGRHLVGDFVLRYKAHKENPFICE